MRKQLQSAILLLNNVFYENKKHTRASFTEVLLAHDLPASKNTISELLKFIDEVFGIELSFRNTNHAIQVIDATDNQYHLVKTLLLNAKLRQKTIAHAHHIISFTTDSEFKNTDLIFEIMNCIAKTRKIKIDYKSFYGEERKNLVLCPQLIKEYNGRWYLIATGEENKIRVYGIDRILDFEELTATFAHNPEARKLYEHTIGVNYDERIEKITLKVENYQLKLFENFPLHHTQNIIERGEKHGVLTLEVVLNYELKQLIASFLTKVEVLSPSSLRMEMQQWFKNMLLLYK